MTEQEPGDIEDLLDLIWSSADHIPQALKGDVIDRAHELIEQQGTAAREELRLLLEAAKGGFEMGPYEHRRRPPPVNPIDDMQHKLRRKQPADLSVAHKDDAAAIDVFESSSGQSPDAESELPQTYTAPERFADEHTDPNYKPGQSYFEELAAQVDVVSGTGAEFFDPERTQTNIPRDKAKPRRKTRTQIVRRAASIRASEMQEIERRRPTVRIARPRKKKRGKGKSST